VAEKSFEQTEVLLAARSYLYAVFQSLLGAEPSEKQYQAISLPLVREAFAHFCEAGHTLEEAEVPTPPYSFEKFLAALEAAAKEPDVLRPEYTRLFVGPGKLPAPPWESVYTSGERVIFQRSTLEVRNCYRSQGFIPQQYPRVADDHLALELGFLSLLAMRALTAFQAGEQTPLRESIQASGEFLDCHMLRWVEHFSSDLTQKGNSTFYATLAQALILFVKRDRESVLLLAQQAGLASK
jgi:TorA maturation chaperone TorD